MFSLQNYYFSCKNEKKCLILHRKTHNFMLKKVFFLFFLISGTLLSNLYGEETLVDYMTTEEFQQVVFNYKENPQQWVYESQVPCVIDFYTTWCGPCKRLAPIMAELSLKYAGMVRFYKVDIEREPELAALFGIRSIPTLLFCPTNDKPQIARGLLPKETLENAINMVLLPQK